MAELLPQLPGNGGVAIGSGNSIPDYTNVDSYLTMNDAVRSWRGE